MAPTATGPASPTASPPLGRSALSSSGSTALKNAHVWPVTSPLPINNPMAGNKNGKDRQQPHHHHHHHHHFLPAQLTPAARRRRISVEVHRVKNVFESTATEICYVRILEPLGRSGGGSAVDRMNVLEPLANKLLKQGEGLKKAKKGTVNFFTGTLRNANRTGEDGDVVANNNNNNNGGGGDDDKDDDDSISDASFMQSFRESSIGNEYSDNQHARQQQQELQEQHAFDGWRPKYKAPLRFFNIVETRKNKRSVVASFELKGRAAHREFVFENERSLAEFVAVVERNKRLLESRLETLLRSRLGNDIRLRPEERLTFLFDMCSGSDLPRADIGRNSDPYVSVRFNGRRVHRTGYISNSDNPIWTLRKGGLFVWRVDALELFRAEEGLIFEVKDYDAIGTNESLGAFNINARTLYKWNGERREFRLKPLLGEKDHGKGKIALRVRRATEHDIEFMEQFNSGKVKISKVVSPPSTSAAAALKSLITSNKKKEKEGPDKGKTKYFIRPGPDPKQKDETAWLTKEKIEEETMKTSHHWTDIGSGTLGKIFVEVLGCNKLPNMDHGGVLGNKTDAFVSLVYEDCFAQTDVIDDCLSPRWMPWTQRAFIFNMMHTSSQLFLAVFDSDPSSSHDLVGRISIDISNFWPNSVYLLEYNLFPSAKCVPRGAKFGTIKIRLRMELEDERTLLLSNFQLPESVYVNVGSKKEYEVIHKTVEGGVDMRKYDIGTINTFCDELMSYLTIYYALEDAFLSLILWRGNSKIPLPVPSFSSRSIKWVGVGFPLHSFMAFIFTICVVEKPNLLPSFWLGSIGWILIATVERRSTNPNPWIRCKSFSHFLSALILNSSSSVATGVEIEVHENVDGIEEAENYWEKRIREAEDRAKERAEEYAREQEQYLKELEEIGETDVDLTKQTGGLAARVDPTRAYLFPIQQYLGIACTWMRIFKNIFVWEEGYISFWTTVLSFTLSVVAFFIPWGFLLKWTMRIIVWVAFGPWMKVADMFYFSRFKTETAQQKKERMNHLQLKRQVRVDKQKLNAQIAREKASKLRDFKQHMFGQHMCKVNVLKKDRYCDVPLPTSSAAFHNPDSKSLGELAMQEAGYRRTRIEGQQLVGDMIPTVNQTPTTEAPTGKPTKNTDLLEKGSSAAFYNGNDSYIAAAIKVASIVVGAGAITWFGVPLFVFLVRQALPE